MSMSSFFRLLVCDSNTDVRDTLKELVLPLAGDLLPGPIQRVPFGPSWSFVGRVKIVVDIMFRSPPLVTFN